MTERRKHKRYSVAYPLETKGKYADSNLILQNISEGGIGFEVTCKMSERERLNLRLFLKKKMFTLQALIVRVDKDRDKTVRKIGVKFLNTSEPFIKAFRKEMESIMQYHRELTLYKRKKLSFKKASEKYLDNDA